MRSLRFRWWAAMLVAATLGLAAPRSATARTAAGAGADEPPTATDRVIKIGPQAVVIVNERGDVRMYDDDPAQQGPTCKSTARCIGSTLGIFGFFFAATYEELTTNVEGSGLNARSLPAEE